MASIAESFESAPAVDEDHRPGRVLEGRSRVFDWLVAVRIVGVCHIVTTETIHTLIAQQSCDQVCSDVQTIAGKTIGIAKGIATVVAAGEESGPIPPSSERSS